jgi:hypothetical protein
MGGANDLPATHRDDGDPGRSHGGSLHGPDRPERKLVRRAAISDANGHVVTISATPVTFLITGLGTIAAVDSASMIDETFRGNVPDACHGLAFCARSGDGRGNDHGDGLGHRNQVGRPASRPPRAHSFGAPRRAIDEPDADRDTPIQQVDAQVTSKGMM